MWSRIENSDTVAGRKYKIGKIIPAVERENGTHFSCEAWERSSFQLWSVRTVLGKTNYSFQLRSVRMALIPAEERENGTHSSCTAWERNFFQLRSVWPALIPAAESENGTHSSYGSWKRPFVRKCKQFTNKCWTRLWYILASLIPN